MQRKDLPRVLCVDDEPNLLDGIKLHLRKHYDVVTAPSGNAGLELIRAERESFSVVLSDMRMPGMSGAVFLANVRELASNSVRMLLTGQTDLNSAIEAVNEGQIFRFLTKPCAPEILLKAFASGVEQHRLLTAERVLLEQTLHGSIKMLTDVLAMASPAVFGRAARLKQRAGQVASRLGLENRWQIEVATMLSQVGFVTVPADTMKKLSNLEPLDAHERAMLDRMPTVAETLISNIPRLENVRAILATVQCRFDGGPAKTPPLGDAIPIGARILKVICDFDELETRGDPPNVALAAMRARVGWYDASVLEALSQAMGDAAITEVRELKLFALRPGMVFADNVKTKSGALLIARGHEVTHGLIERLQNMPTGHIPEPLRMILRVSPRMVEPGWRREPICAIECLPTLSTVAGA